MFSKSITQIEVYVKFPGTSSDLKKNMGLGTLWESGYNHFAKA